jgi:multicomponent Na+:H+ antiporter subunit G
MSELVSDILIYLLLLSGVGFGGIALMGLLIFPDIRSRMYTALRASLISMGAVLGAAVIYAFTAITANSGTQYSTFLIHALFLGGVIAVGVMFINKQVLEKTKSQVYCGNPPLQNTEEKKNES